MPPVYVVSGFMRSGTSMMMRALEAGGLEACYRDSRNKFGKAFADAKYDPNEGGLYELERADYARPGFPAGYEGKLIKCLRRGVARMNPMPGGIKVVFMRRDPEEIRQSYLAFFGEAPSREAIEAEIQASLAADYNRRDTQVLELWMRNVIEHPLACFERVKAAGFPIDPEAAAAIVDAEQYRYRIEELEVGVL